MPAEVVPEQAIVLPGTSGLTKTAKIYASKTAGVVRFPTGRTRIPSPLVVVKPLQIMLTFAHAGVGNSFHASDYCAMFWRAMLRLLSRQTGYQTTEVFVEARRL